MKKNEMVLRDVVSLKIPEKFAEDHPVATILINLAPVAIPATWEGVKYIVDKVVAYKRFKVMVENGYIISNDVSDYETISDAESIAA